MLSPDYVLDSELNIDVGQLPSAVQVQALTEALTRLRRRFLIAQKMLSQPAAPLHVAPIAGLSPAWQQRLREEMAFIEAAYVQLQRLAGGYVRNAVSNAAVSGDWNRWSSQAVAMFGEAVGDFERESSRGMSNSVMSGIPAGFIKLATIAKMNPPTLDKVVPVGLSAIELSMSPWWLVAGVVGGLWWLSESRRELY